MILRKPYALLIKYFKLIHIIMFVSFGYLVFSLRKIYVFFAEYIKTSNFRYVENMANIYVPWILIIIVIILLLLSISILLLMRKKGKPILFYKVMIGYCSALLIVLIYYMIFFKSLDNTVYETLRIAVNRDIILFAYIVNFFFVAFTFIRGFGFDIKKFSFDRDKKELNLDESDSEEYELNVNVEKEDIKSFFNRQKRELSYYVKENKMFLIIVAVIIVVSGSLYIYYDRFVINKVYKQSDNVSVGNLIYHVNSSLISNIDKYGQDISSENDYLIVDMSIINNERNGYLDKEAMRVHIDDDYYYPVSACDMFNDLGTCYDNQELKVDNENKFILVYRIKKDYDVIYLEILKNKGEEYQYSKIKLSYTKESVPETLTSDGGITVNGQDYTITNYSLSNKVSYEYEECISDVCNTYIKKITPKTGETIVVIEMDKIDGLTSDFLNNSVGIKYNNKIYTGKAIQLVGTNKNTLYYSIPIYATSNNDLSINIMTRQAKYAVQLGDENNE